jgi:hypothetical protein
MGLCGYSQTVTVIEQSGYKHDYALVSLQFIEDAKDTSRLKYIATVSLSDKQTHLLGAGGFLGLLQIKAKELGANCYLVSGFSENETLVDLQVKLFFAGQRYIKANKLKADMNSAYVFNQTRFSNDTASFYLNSEKVNFDPKKYFTVKMEPGKTYYIATNENKMTSKKISLKKPGESTFFIVPASKKTIILTNIALSPPNTGMSINGVYIYFKRNSPYKLNYEVGRLLMEIYR